MPFFGNVASASTSEADDSNDYDLSGDLVSDVDGIAKVLGVGAEITSPIPGVEETPTLPLAETLAAARAATGLSAREEAALIKKSNKIVDKLAAAVGPAGLDGLTRDEAASINIYTQETPNIYRKLNTMLRDGDRDPLKPWFPYLKLLLTALHKLPSCPGTYNRIVSADIASQYTKGMKMVWWEFSSSTATIEALGAFMQVGKPRVLFQLEVQRVVDINRFSEFSGDEDTGNVGEDERLLLSGIPLEVKSIQPMGGGLTMIQMTEELDRLPPIPGFTLKSPPPWEVDPKEIKIDMKEDDDDDDGAMVKIELGRGSFGIVYAGRFKGRVVAVKHLSEVSEIMIKAFRSEASIAFRLQHKNVAHCYGGVIKQNFLRLISERLEASLRNDLHIAKVDMSAEVVRSTISQVAQGLAYLHQNKVVHRDLKPDNVMRNAKHVWKLIDFGLASSRSSSMATKSSASGANRGTAGYMAPELYSRGGDHTVDTFAFAMLAYETTMRSPPYVDVNALAVGRKVEKGERPDLANTHANLTADIADIIRACWDHRPERRPPMLTVAAQLMDTATKLPAIAVKLALSADDLKVYSALWTEAPTTNEALPGADALRFFATSGLAIVDLKIIWDASSTTAPISQLSRGEFFAALKLIAVKQNGGALNPAAFALAGQPLPKIGVNNGFPAEEQRRKAAVDAAEGVAAAKAAGAAAAAEAKAAEEAVAAVKAAEAAAAAEAKAAQEAAAKAAEAAAAAEAKAAQEAVAAVKAAEAAAAAEAKATEEAAVIDELAKVEKEKGNVAVLEAMDIDQSAAKANFVAKQQAEIAEMAASNNPFLNPFATAVEVTEPEPERDAKWNPFGAPAGGSNAAATVDVKKKKEKFTQQLMLQKAKQKINEVTNVVAWLGTKSARLQDAEQEYEDAKVLQEGRVNKEKQSGLNAKVRMVLASSKKLHKDYAEKVAAVQAKSTGEVKHKHKLVKQLDDYEKEILVGIGKEATLLAACESEVNAMQSNNQRFKGEIMAMETKCMNDGMEAAEIDYIISRYKLTNSANEARYTDALEHVAAANDAMVKFTVPLKEVCTTLMADLLFPEEDSPAVRQAVIKAEAVRKDGKVLKYRTLIHQMATAERGDAQYDKAASILKYIEKATGKKEVLLKKILGGIGKHSVHGLLFMSGTKIGKPWEFRHVYFDLRDRHVTIKTADNKKDLMHAPLKTVRAVSFFPSAGHKRSDGKACEFAFCVMLQPGKAAQTWNFSAMNELEMIIWKLTFSAVLPPDNM